MDPTLLLVTGVIATFLAMVVVTIVAFNAVIDRQQVNRSLRTVREGQLSGDEVRKKELSTPALQRLVMPGLSGIGRGVLRFTPAAIVERLDQEVVYAGSPQGWDGARVMAVKVTLAAGLAVLAVVALPAGGFGILRTIVLVPFLGFVGYYLPEWILRSRSSQRQEEIRRALPDSLDLLSITVEAGLGFEAALERVSKEVGGPLGEELYRVVQEMRLGKGRGEALRDLAERTTVDELKSFVLAMVQAEVFGISISRVLHVQAGELRIRRRQYAEERAQKIPVKIVFPLILCIFPALFVVLLGPAAISIYEDFILGL